MWHISSFYRFASIPEDNLLRLKKDFENRLEALEVLGLILFSKEGSNATVAGSLDAMNAFKQMVLEIPGFDPVIWKDSTSEKKPFKRLVIDIRTEIVTMKRPDLFPEKTSNNHLSPSDWHQALNSNDDFVLLDTRNDYETQVGIFRGAVDPKLKVFSEFGPWVTNSNIPKDKKVLMYCTGGVRCEKAILEMQSQGYNNVFQLEGGILKYLEEFPHQNFEGECYVFDHRLAVDQELNPSKNYSLCPLCGDPASRKITCNKCKTEAVICPSCASDATSQACSKNCRYYLRTHSSNGDYQGIPSRR